MITIDTLSSLHLSLPFLVLPKALARLLAIENHCCTLLIRWCVIRKYIRTCNSLSALARNSLTIESSIPWKRENSRRLRLSALAFLASSRPFSLFLSLALLIIPYSCLALSHVLSPPPYSLSRILRTLYEQLVVSQYRDIVAGGSSVSLLLFLFSLPFFCLRLRLPLTSSCSFVLSFLTSFNFSSLINRATLSLSPGLTPGYGVSFKCPYPRAFPAAFGIFLHPFCARKKMSRKIAPRSLQCDSDSDDDDVLTFKVWQR